jgi:eukaryotic translation initiation factor 2C
MLIFAKQVLEQEVADLKALFKTFGKDECKFLVVVGSKRHHVRFFPERGDRNGNALPGTLVETGVTHPFENDFYLVGHVALKGTARPMHYHVLLNEVGMSNEELQTLIYEHSYQYARATTPVSMFPAIYYAHIASNRGVCHDKNWNDSTSGNDEVSSDSAAAMDNRKCMDMPNQGAIQSSMWYI